MFLLWIVPLVLLALLIYAFVFSQSDTALQTVTRRVCTSCGQEVEGGSKVCPYCGQAL